MLRKQSVVILLLVFSSTAFAQSYSYDAISKRYKDVELNAKQVKRARMEGECLVGLKNLNFRKQQKFDAVAEWSNLRSFSLLEQFSPCTVLIIMEVAHSKLKNGNADK